MSLTRRWQGGIALLTALGLTAAAPGAESSRREQAAARLFASTDPVPHLQIQISSADFDLLRESRSAKSGQDRPEVAATVREGATVYRQVALHLKGAGGSFQPVDDKPAFTLNFDETMKGQRFHGLEKISLNNSTQDPTYLSEHLGRMMFNAAGLPVPRVTHATVSLNGRRLGLYVLVEGWNKDFLRRHFADAEGAFYEPPFRRDLPGPLLLKSGDDAAGARKLAALEAALDEGDDTAWAALNGALDGGRFTRGLALEILINHWDGYARNQNNYRLFHDRTVDRLVFLPHGMDQLFALRRPDTELPLLPEMRGRVARTVMDTPEGRRRYLQDAGWLLTNVFVVEPLVAEVRRLEDRVHDALAESPSAQRTFDSQVSLLVERIRARHGRMTDELAGVQDALNLRGTNSVPLRGWNLRNNERRSYQTISPAQRAGPLRLSAGSSRYETTLLLEPGRYRFSGRSSVTGLAGRAAGSSSVLVLRGSAGRDARQVLATDGPVSLGHTFTVETPRVITLSCEFQSSGGTATFERDSLRLARLEP